MVDIQILEDGKVILSRDLKKGEIVQYQNSKNETVNMYILRDINKRDGLRSGIKCGEIVAKADDDLVVIKRLIKFNRLNR